MQNENSAADAMSMLDLIALQNILDEYDLPTSILEQSGALPLNTLLTNPTQDYNGRTRTISFCFLPLENEHFPDVKLLQFYSEFNFEIQEQSMPMTQELIIRLNKLLALGALGISDNNKVYLRYVHTLGKFDSLQDSEDTIVSIFNLFIYNLNVNAKVVEMVGTAKQDVETAYTEFIQP